MKRDFITILALMTALSSCNDDALFEKEMYKNVVALISSDYYNTFEEVVTLSPTGEEATGYIAACTGGTHAPKTKHGDRAGRRPDFTGILQPVSLRRR